MDSLASPGTGDGFAQKPNARHTTSLGALMRLMLLTLSPSEWLAPWDFVHVDIAEAGSTKSVPLADDVVDIVESAQERLVEGILELFEPFVDVIELDLGVLEEECAHVG